MAYILVLTALFNLFNGIIMVADYRIFYALLGGTAYAPADPVWFHIVGGLVLLFGAAYYSVARNLEAHNDIVIVGAIGKMIVWISATGPWLTGAEGVNTTWQLIAIAQIDLIFSLFFILFLIKREPCCVEG